MEKINNLKEPIIKSARKARFIIRLTGTLVGLIVGYLQMKNLPLDQIVGSLSTELIMKLTLIIYYFSWLFGNLNDANDQELVLIYQKELSPNFQMISIIILLSIFFILLCFVNTFNQRIFLILGIIIMDLISGKYFKSKYIHSALEFSLEQYCKNNEHVLYMKLLAVKEHIYGPWQKIRYIFGFVFITTFGIIIFTPISKLIQSQLVKINLEVLYSLLFLVFIMLWEGFVWIKRYEIKVIFKTFERLIEDHQFEIKRKNL